MEKVAFRILTAVIFLASLSCKKEEPDQQCSTCPVGGGTEPQGFYFKKNGGAQIKADSAYFIPASRIITCFYQGVSTRITLKSSAQTPAVYSFTSSANTLTYAEPLGTYSAIGGELTITANTGTKISGSFVSNGSGVMSTLSGQFKDVPRK